MLHVLQLNSRLIGGGCAALTLGTLVFACPPDACEETTAATVDRVVKYEPPSASATQRVAVVRSQTNGDEVIAEAFEIDMDGDDVRVRVNGNDLNAGRIRMEDGTIVIYDDDGAEISRMSLGLDALQGLDAFGRFEFDGSAFEPGFGHLRLLPGGLQADGTMDLAPPKVMLGIHLGEPSRDLLYHLGYEEGTTTLVQSLYKGLPANRAGIGEFDVIVAIDGAKPADPVTLRTVLAERDAGDTLELTVVSRGTTRNAEVVLEAYDATAMTPERRIGDAPQTTDLDFTFDRVPQALRVFVDPGENQIFEVPNYQFDGNGRARVAMPNAVVGVPSSAKSFDDARLDRLDERLRSLERSIEILLERVKGPND